MTANEIIQYLIDNDKIFKILENLECHHIKEYKNEFRCGLKNYSSKNNVSIKKDSLKIKIFQSDGKTIYGNLFNLIMHIKDINFSQANKYIHKLLGLEYVFNFKKYTEEKEFNDPLAIFKKVKRKKCYDNLEDIKICDDSVLKEYIPLPHIDWIRIEGIMPWTCEKFKIGYSAEKKRIIIPIRFWCGSEENYIGIIGRTTIKEYEMLDIPKYFPLKSYPKSFNLYGLQENYKTIQENNYVVVYEAEKSTLKRHSRGDGTGVAIGSHCLSEEQVKILIGLNVEIIIAYDKDISLEYIWSECDKFYGIRNVSYIWDKYDLLKDKESPADAPNKIYNYLFKHKIKYDEGERKKYLQWQEKQAKN